MNKETSAQYYSTGSGGCATLFVNPEDARSASVDKCQCNFKKIEMTPEQEAAWNKAWVDWTNNFFKTYFAQDRQSEASP